MHNTVWEIVKFVHDFQKKKNFPVIYVLMN